MKVSPDPATTGDIGGVHLAQAMFPEPDSDLSFERSEDNSPPGLAFPAHAGRR
jgi:hypothetical protein